MSWRNDIADTAGRRATAAETLRALAGGASIEVPPGALANATPLSETLPAGTAVYVPFLPRARFEDSIVACRTLLRDGMRPVPHLPARAVPGRDHLQDWLERLAAIGVDSLFLIAGDTGRPRGPYRDSLRLLETGLLQRYGFRRLGVAGYPEGHPEIGAVALRAALADKAAYARDTATEMWLVTQFTFEAEPVTAWLAAMREPGPALPVRIGLAGPAKLRTLLVYAMRCGVGVSARSLLRRPSMTRRLAGRWTPETVLAALARHCAAESDGPVAGIHLFTFGGVRQSAEWLRSVRQAGGETPCNLMRA